MQLIDRLAKHVEFTASLPALLATGAGQPALKREYINQVLGTLPSDDVDALALTFVRVLDGMRESNSVQEWHTHLEVWARHAFGAGSTLAIVNSRQFLRKLSGNP